MQLEGFVENIDLKPTQALHEGHKVLVPLTCWFHCAVILETGV